MVMKLLHALAAFLTVLVYLVRRRRCELARVCGEKRSTFDEPSLSQLDDNSQTSVVVPQACSLRVGCTGAGRVPRYKRDPVIEDFAVPPRE